MNRIAPHYAAVLHIILSLSITFIAINSLPFSSWQFVVIPSLFISWVNLFYLILKNSGFVSLRITTLITFLVFLLLTFSPYLANFTNILTAVYAIFTLSFIGLINILFTDLTGQKFAYDNSQKKKR